MRFTQVLLFLSIACCALAATDANVLVLDDTNFDSTLSTIDISLVEFYAPWCGHCKKLEPQWNEAADILAADPELSKNVKICKMDADAHKIAPGKFGVTGFPTIKLFRLGKFAEDFSGERTPKAIIDYLTKKAAVAVNREITTLANLKALTSPKNVATTTIIGFFSSKESVDYKYYAAVVTEFSSTGGIDAYHTATASVLEGFGFFGGGSSIVIYRPNGKPFKVAYRGTIFKQQLREWILENALAAIGTYSKETEALYSAVGSPVVRFITGPGTQADGSLLKSLSEKNPTFKFVTCTKADYPKDFETHCEDQAAAMCVVGHEAQKNGKGGRIFGMAAGAVNAETVSQFIKDLTEKKLKARVKSEAPAARPKAGEVAVLVGSTFDEIAMDNTKDVLIEFYAPWCGHCKALTPKYDALALQVAGDFDTLLIAKIDMIANDLPSEYASIYPVSGFPTLFFAPKGKKKSPIAYDGKRETDVMLAWIKEKTRK